MPRARKRRARRGKRRPPADAEAAPNHDGSEAPFAVPAAVADAPRLSVATGGGGGGGSSAAASGGGAHDAASPRDLRVADEHRRDAPASAVATRGRSASEHADEMAAAAETALPQFRASPARAAA